MKKIWDMDLNSEKMETLYTDLNERAEATYSNYSVTGDFLLSFLL